MICERCHAGQTTEYSRRIDAGDRSVSIQGKTCSRCGFVELDNDDDIWSTVGL